MLADSESDSLGLTVDDGMVARVSTVSPPSTQLLPTEPAITKLPKGEPRQNGPVTARQRSRADESVGSSSVRCVGGVRYPDVLVLTRRGGGARLGVPAGAPGRGGRGAAGD